MTSKESLQRISGLIESVERKSRPFREKCAQAKILAFTNPDEARTKYLHLVHQAFPASGTYFEQEDCCKGKMKKVKSAIDSGEVNRSFQIALDELRSSFLQDVLRPAVKGYLINNAHGQLEIENLYTSIMQIDGLLEVARFLNKIDF
ncbi:MAG: hypothetical protein ACTSUB_01340 [Candidatus Thorarchaeota archaeon]